MTSDLSREKHECPLPQGPNLGISGASAVWVCPECGRHWQFVKPWSMYPSWRPVQIGPLLEGDYR